MCSVTQQQSYYQNIQPKIYLILSFENLLQNEGISTEKVVTIKSSILHGISLVCAALLVTSKLQLDSYYRLINNVIFLHPILVWLDRHVVAVAVTGLFTGLTAKLLLGKYRYHNIFWL